ncbi:phage tail assembly chaperone [Spirosoma profusum]|uniref:phage tail assembly chaperone n=1 Tax=Spirosoma profusum TaxID=2771354 RepID=UPI0037439519
MGLSPAEFWEMTPADFSRMLEGYYYRNRQQGVYFRELYALLFNINKGEKTPYLEPKEVLRLIGEPRSKKVKNKTALLTPEQIQLMEERVNRQMGLLP